MPNKTNIEVNNSSYLHSKKSKKRSRALTQEEVLKITPYDIRGLFDEDIVGQDEAKKYLAISVCDHIKRTFSSKNLAESIPKNNVFIVGPTGSGKTQLCRTLAKNLSLPFVDFDATRLSMVGYEGESVSNIFESLIHQTGGNVLLAERAIIFIDELDKKSNNFGGAGVSTEQVQNSLLKILEGTDIVVKYKNEKKTIRTHNMLFIGGGAFDNINAFEREVKGSVGIRLDEAKSTKINRRDLSSFLEEQGMISQLLGRFSTFVRTHNLNCEQKKFYLEKLSSSILNKNKLRFMSYGVLNVTYSDCFIDFLITESKRLNTGVRGLDSLVMQYCSNALSDIDEKVVSIKFFKEGFRVNKRRKINAFEELNENS